MWWKPVLLVVAGIALLALSYRAIATAKGRPRGELVLTAITQTFTRGGTSSTNHSVLVYYHSPHRAPPGASASLDIPAGLGLDANIPMQVDNIEPASSVAGPDVLRYWGEGRKIPRGEPYVSNPNGHRVPHYRDGSTGIADPTRLAYITASASSQGVYVAHVSYVGDVSVSLSEAQEFLEPILLEPPDENPDFFKPITLRWSFVRHCVGYVVTASGHNANGQAVIWENALDSDAWRAKGATDALRHHKLIPAYQTSCVVPARIFASGPVVVNITALSPEVRGTGVMKYIGWAESSTSMRLEGTP